MPDGDEAYCAGHIGIVGDTYLIAQIYTQKNGNRIANGRLIAVAPRMLAALKGVGCVCPYGIGQPGFSSHSAECQAVSTAIEEAEGRQS